MPIDSKDFPKELYSAEWVWPCKQEVTDDKFLTLIPTQMSEVYRFMNEAVKRIKV